MLETNEKKNRSFQQRYKNISTETKDRAGDVAQAVAHSPSMRAARVRSSAPRTNKDVVSAEN